MWITHLTLLYIRVPLGACPSGRVKGVKGVKNRVKVFRYNIMKSRFKEICISAKKLTVDLDDILKVAAGEIKIAYILHDKNAVQPHYHIVLDFGENLVEDNVVTDLFKIGKQFICAARVVSWKDYKQYLVHTHDYEYSESEIVANFDISNF